MQIYKRTYLSQNRALVQTKFYCYEYKYLRFGYKKVNL
jgi:hypothetical protein